MSLPKIVIFNDTHGWHSEQLVTALQPLGITAVLTDLAYCMVDLDQPTGLIIPGFEEQLPAAAMIRGIAPGSLEQITLRMDVLHTLSELGVPVFNSANAIEHTVDKARTSLRLHLAGITTPRTWACEDRNLARHIAQQQFSDNKPLVIKPLFGCMGQGIEKINTIEQFDALQAVGNAFYMQEYIDSFEQDHWQDWRLMVIGGQICAAMSRRSQHWITNVAQGAECFATTISDDMAQLAINATDAVQADYAGVDLIRQKNGAYTVLEVNSVPAWRGLYQTTGINIANDLARALSSRIRQAPDKYQHLC